MNLPPPLPEPPSTPDGVCYAYRVNRTDGDRNIVIVGLIGYWRSPQDAVVASEHQGWWGGPGMITIVPILSLNGQCYELASVTPITLDASTPYKDAQETIRQKALQKLSKAERELLGLVNMKRVNPNER